MVLRLLNFKSDEDRVTIDLGRPLRGAWTVRPDERERRRTDRWFEGVHRGRPPWHQEPPREVVI